MTGFLGPVCILIIMWDALLAFGGTSDGIRYVAAVNLPVAVGCTYVLIRGMI